MTKLYQKSRYYKPLSLEVKGKEYTLNSFVFYNKDGIILKTNHGWLENGLEPNFEFEVVKKLKENFTKKEAYILKSKDFSLSDVYYELYIHEDLVGLKKPIYKISSNMVFATYDSNIDNFKFDIYIKSLEDDLYNVRKEINKLCEELECYRISSESLESTILKLVELKEKLKQEEEKLKNYTIEDYLNSIK